ncbi:MAG: AraC family transcriptional regulator [Lentisphaerota bacterium]
MLNKIKNIRKISNIPKSCIEKYLDLKGKKADPLKELGVFYSGISRLKSGYRIGAPDHQGTYITIFTKSGTGHLLSSQGEIIMTADSVTVIPAWEPCLWEVYRDEWTILWFHCHETPWWREFKGRALYKPTAFIPRLEIAMTGYLQETADHQPDPEQENAAGLYSRIIASHLRRSLQDSDSVSGSQLELENLRDEIKSSLSKNWNSKLMAKKLNISASTLQRRCLEHYHKTPRQILIEMRMDYAETLVECTDYPLKTIARSTGYSDEFIFSAAFKNHFGLSPKLYRKEQKQL